MFFTTCVYTSPPELLLRSSLGGLGPLTLISSRLSKLTRYIVEKRHTHQEDEQRYADLLAKGLRPLG
jgi:hypothetical protein